MIIDFRLFPPLSEHMDLEEAMESLMKGYMRRYAGKYGNIEAVIEIKTADIVRSMNESGVDKAVMQAEWAFGNYRKQNDAVYRIVRAYPDKFAAGFLCLNPLEEDDMAAVVEREVREREFRGVNLQPFAYRLRCNDKRFYPVYAKCVELDIPVTIHTSINFSVSRSIDFGRPLYLDEVACDFPELKIVANHGGWPWVNEMVAVAWKHPNVYIEIGAVSPKYIGMPGTGWESLLVYGNSLLQDQVLFATDLLIPFKSAVQEVMALPLKDAVKKKWLGNNAAKLLKL